MMARQENGGGQKGHVAVVGAGLGGLTAAMLLASRGIRVSVFEKNNHVGGRNSAIRLGPFIFDAGPTFLIMKFVLDEVFAQAGRKVDDYIKFSRLEPMYSLRFDDREFVAISDWHAMTGQLKQVFPGDEGGFDRFLAGEKRRYDAVLPCFRKHYSGLWTALRPDLLKALPFLSLNRSLFGVLGDYFKAEKARLSFAFQSRYLGMSPWECPAAFGIIPYIEYAFGVYHVLGGLSEIPEAMARVVREMGGVINLGSPVRRVLVKGKRAVGLELEKGGRVEADEVVINADFAYSASNLFDEGVLKKYSRANLQGKKFSCSAFMMYMGLDKVYQMPHHTVVFASDYQANVEDVFEKKILSDDMSFHICNASVTDPTLAPPGKSAVHVQVLVPNRSAGINWMEERVSFRGRILDLIESRTLMKDLAMHIEEEMVITPDEWERDYHVYRGAVFSLAHSLDQMLFMRPGNRFEEISHCYLAGGGTHPGSGVPAVIESGRISAEMIMRSRGIPAGNAG